MQPPQKCFVAMSNTYLCVVVFIGIKFYPLGNSNDQIPLQTTGIEREGLVLTVGRSVALMTDLMPIKNEPPSPGVCASFPLWGGIRIFITVRLKMPRLSVSLIFGRLHVDHCGVGRVA